MDATWILLHKVEGPINLGSVCRAMANTGFRHLRFTGALESDDFEARKFALHARDLLADGEKHQDFKSLVSGMDVLFGFSPRSPWTDGRDLAIDDFHDHYAKARARGEKVGLLFGNEARGLENMHLAHCQFRVRLPTRREYVSMNLAQAVMVVLWELHRGQGAGPKRDVLLPEWASPEEKQALLNNIHGFLDVLEFLDPQNPEHLWMEILPIFNSRDWTKRELTILQAIFGKSSSRHRALKKKLARYSD